MLFCALPILIFTGEDFDTIVTEGTPITLEFQPDEQSLSIQVNVTDDNIPENVESFTLFLNIPVSDVPGFMLGSIPTTAVSIVDNDGEQQ